MVRGQLPAQEVNKGIILMYSFKGTGRIINDKSVDQSSRDSNLTLTRGGGKKKICLGE